MFYICCVELLCFSLSFVVFVPQSQVWVEDQDQKHKLMEEYKSNLRYVHNHQPV